MIDARRTPGHVPPRRRISWLFVVLWLVVIAWGSLSPGVGVPAGSDLVFHALAYLVLAWLIRSASAARPRWQGWLLAGACAWGFGFLMEVTQGALVYRSAEIRDLMANGLGAAIGVVLPFGHRGELGRS
jgi:VanZ family protein